MEVLGFRVYVFKAGKGLVLGFWGLYSWASWACCGLDFGRGFGTARFGV